MNGGSSLNYLLLGFFNILWTPMAMKLGRKPVYILSSLLVIITMSWSRKMTGVTQWFINNLINGMGTAGYQATIQLTIFDMFYVHERGRMLAVYLFSRDLGAGIGLISGGRMNDTMGWRWSQVLVGIMTAVAVVVFIFAFEETLFPRFLFTDDDQNAINDDGHKLEYITKDVLNEADTKKNHAITNNIQRNH
ncbi:unnamed protein product [Ambrosiozyma monospora]|uniref:Unnamed protein product n=1 Tax=Ambrosiozyma monospora TaxID=43982 RepID=A0A9W6T9K4_AMBMO|nr:unnamed protein product [Ambrosiozyma monospora]